jgi:hypothetical protein
MNSRTKPRQPSAAEKGTPYDGHEDSLLPAALALPRCPLSCAASQVYPQDLFRADPIWSQMSISCQEGPILAYRTAWLHRKWRRALTVCCSSAAAGSVQMARNKVHATIVLVHQTLTARTQQPRTRSKQRFAENLMPGQAALIFLAAQRIAGTSH